MRGAGAFLRVLVVLAALLALPAASAQAAAVEPPQIVGVRAGSGSPATLLSADRPELLDSDPRQPYTEVMVSGIASYGGLPSVPKVNDPYWTAFLVSIPGNPCGSGSSNVVTTLILPPSTQVDSSRPIKCYGLPRNMTRTRPGRTWPTRAGASWARAGPTARTQPSISPYHPGGPAVRLPAARQRPDVLDLRASEVERAADRRGRPEPGPRLHVADGRDRRVREPRPQLRLGQRARRARSARTRSSTSRRSPRRSRTGRTTRRTTRAREHHDEEPRGVVREPVQRVQARQLLLGDLQGVPPPPARRRIDSCASWARPAGTAPSPTSLRPLAGLRRRGRGGPERGLFAALLRRRPAEHGLHGPLEVHPSERAPASSRTPPSPRSPARTRTATAFANNGTDRCPAVKGTLRERLPARRCRTIRTRTASTAPQISARPQDGQGALQRLPRRDRPRDPEAAVHPDARRDPPDQERYRLQASQPRQGRAREVRVHGRLRRALARSASRRRSPPSSRSRRRRRPLASPAARVRARPWAAAA